MRARIARSVIFTLVALFVTIGDAQSAQRSRDRLARDLCFIRLADGADPLAARAFIEARGGRIALITSRDSMLGWIPATVERTLNAHKSILSIGRGNVDVEQMPAGPSRMGAGAFNWIVSGAARSEAVAASSVRGLPLSDDAFVQLAPGQNARDRIPVSALGDCDPRRILPMASQGACGNSETMNGLVTLAIFFIESNGTGSDPNKYTWTSGHQTDTYNRSAEGLAWWVAQAAGRGISLAFNLIVYGATDPACQVPYEPILHSTNDEALWINRIMSNVGAASVTAFNTSLRTTTSSDWAYTLFIAYNPGSESTFTDGYFAYAYLGGPYTQMCYNNDGWGAANFGNVLAHESAHIFWANDEYYQPGYGGCTSCGRYSNCPRPDATNGNCERCNSRSRYCIMRDGTPSDGLCSYTPYQIGWGGGGGGGTYSISGKAMDSRGRGMSGVNMSVSGSSSDSKNTGSRGRYRFSGLSAGNYTVQPSEAGVTFRPRLRNLAITTYNLTRQNFRAR